MDDAPVDCLSLPYGRSDSARGDVHRFAGFALYIGTGNPVGQI